MSANGRSVELSHAWRGFAYAWGIDPDQAVVTHMPGGLINDTYTLTSGARKLVLRHYKRTTRPEDIRYELSAIDYLARNGFPTAEVVRSASGDLFGWIEDRPAAVFKFVTGAQPLSRDGGNGSFDLALGCQLAATAARLHLLTWDSVFPGKRSERPDPLRRIGDFLDNVNPGDWRGVNGFTDFLARLEDTRATLQDAIRRTPPGRLPSGLAHNDINETNVLVDGAGSLVALLDFDDCIESHRIYDLCSVIAIWGLDSERHVDTERAGALVAAYRQCRPLTTEEADLLPLFLMCYLGAHGSDVINNVRRYGTFDRGVTDSYSATTFLSLHAARDKQESIKNSART